MKGWPISRLAEIPMSVDIQLLAEILGISRRTIERRIAAKRFPIPRQCGVTSAPRFSGYEVKRYLRQSTSERALRLVW